jgi:hypothetical protein
MVVSLARSELEDVLERAIRDARAPSTRLDRRWTDRVAWLSREVAGGDAKGKTYIAATGAALLAKATNDAVDTLTQSRKGEPRGYGLRGVAEPDAESGGTVHLGTLSKRPMNNAPFLRGPARIDRFTIAGYLQHVCAEYLSWMQELDGYNSAQAYTAPVAFLAGRIKAQRDEDSALATGPRMTAERSIADMLDAVQLWLTEDPEEGARGQALLAGALDLVWDDIELVPKHHPAPFDVRRRARPLRWSARASSSASACPRYWTWPDGRRGVTAISRYTQRWRTTSRLWPPIAFAPRRSIATAFCSTSCTMRASS